MTTQHYNRPSAGYAGEAGLPNRTKYYTDSTSSPKVPISSTKVDGDINYLIDAVNELYDTAVSGSLPDGAVTNAKMADRGACSVIGRSANSTGAPADISAATNDVVLVRKSNSLSFSTVPTAGIDDAAITSVKIADTNVTFAKIQNVNTNVLVGRSTAGAGSVEQVTVGEGLSLTSGTLYASGINAGYANNNYYFGNGFNVGATKVITANTIIYVPFRVRETKTFTRIGFNISSGSAGNARIGIYTASNGIPGSLVVDAGAVSTAGTGNVEATIAQQLTPGIYFYAAVFSATPTVRSPNANSPFVREILGVDTINASLDTACLLESYSYAALPASPGTLVHNNSGEAITMWLRVV